MNYFEKTSLSEKLYGGIITNQDNAGLLIAGGVNYFNSCHIISHKLPIIFNGYSNTTLVNTLIETNIKVAIGNGANLEIPDKYQRILDDEIPFINGFPFLHPSEIPVYVTIS